MESTAVEYRVHVGDVTATAVVPAKPRHPGAGQDPMRNCLGSAASDLKSFNAKVTKDAKVAKERYRLIAPLRAPRAQRTQTFLGANRLHR